MGIKNLNQFLLKTCDRSSIRKINFEYLKNKIIVVDISIYLYKFMSYGCFMENLYAFLSIFKYYLITPIFIFDGKPPPEKWALLKKRRWEKKDAETRYLELQSAITNQDISLNKILENEMEELRKKMVRVKQDDIKKVKELMDAFGLLYYDAPGEADQLCAYFVNTDIAWACMSDDMDMFLYGCTRVLRNLSLMNHQIMIYDTPKILNDLGLSSNEFLEIAILCGTDYNDGYHSLIKTIELHKEYKKDNNNDNNSFHSNSLTVYEGNDNKETKDNFYNWFIKTSHLIETSNFSNICELFDISTQAVYLDNFVEKFKIEVLEKVHNIGKIKEIMTNYGFLFV
jgi:flap endonuclease-1